MKSKHILRRIEHCLFLAKNSPCPRARFGALIVDPVRNSVISEGWNGPPKGESVLCGGTTCDRNECSIKSGCDVQVGCVHAEMNAICNAAAQGSRCDGAWLFVNGAPCLMCAKLIHHSGIKKVILLKGGYGPQEGLNYLEQHDVPYEEVSDA